ncbi:MAG: hypothetical protein HY705_10060 [Gemmatimonadetes bacterium]|nr:hypothetical protein [Gemmatimonadota bacterium]
MRTVTCIRRGWWVSVAFGCLATAGCAARRVEGWKVAPGATPAAGASAEFEAARGRAMAHWERRDSVPELRAAIADLEEASRLSPADVEVASLISRAYYLLAENLENEEERLATYQTGTQRGEQAMSINPGFRAAMTRGRNDAALAALGREHVPALYWTAVNLGRWARAKGFMTILANRSRIQRLVRRVTALDSTYFHAAPDRYWGAYYSIAPSIAGGDKNRSRVHFERALQIEPNYIGTRVTYAETYAVGVQNRALFEEQLRLALATPVDAIPGIIPEQKLEQQKARRFLARVDELFAR